MARQIFVQAYRTLTALGSPSLPNAPARFISDSHRLNRGLLLYPETVSAVTLLLYCIFGGLDRGSGMTFLMPDVLTPVSKGALGYGGSRPHFKIHLAIDAVVSIALVLAAFQVVTASSRQHLSDRLKISGAVAFSAPDLVKFIKKEDLAAYWAGPDLADKYTVIATSPGQVVITYFPKNADIHKLSTNDLVVQTGTHFSAVEVVDYLQSVSESKSHLMNQGAGTNAIRYNPTAPTQVTMTFKKEFATVTLYDSTPGAALSAALKSGEVRRIT